MSIRPLTRRDVTALAMAFLAGCTSTSAPTYSAAIQEGQTAAHEALRRGNTTALGIALVTPDRVVWAESFGLADPVAGTAPSDSTMFSIGSVSKMFATVAVMQLVEKGLVELDAPLVRYLPSFRMDDSRFADITVRMLLAHSSGLPGGTYRNNQATSPLPDYAGQVLAALAEERLKAPPGYMSVYCNDGFTLVDPLVVAVTGRTYADHVRTEILEPLGMSHSAYTLAPFPDGSYARFSRGGVVEPMAFVGSQGSAGLFTTPTDMAAFLRVFLNRGSAGGARILSPSSIDAMAVDQTTRSFNPEPSVAMAYGLGWDSVTEEGLHAVGVAAWNKAGHIDQYAAEIVVVPEAGLGVVVMGTAGPGFDTLAIAQRVLLRALVETGRIPTMPEPLLLVAAPAAPLPDGTLAEISGYYATSSNVVHLRPEEDGSVSLLTFDGRGFSSGQSLRYRSDGWFTSDASPLNSFRALRTERGKYLARRFMIGGGHSLDRMASAQGVEPRNTGLSPAWRGRVGSTWLLVNERPDSSTLERGDPRFVLSATPELEGFVIAHPQGGAWQLLDPSRSETRAEMMLVIPGANGRDLNDLDVVQKDGEEWVRWGDDLYRPIDVIPVLAPHATSTVTISPAGNAEWRKVEAGPVPVAITLTGGTAWIFYDPDFQILDRGLGSGQVTMPAGDGFGLLTLFGTPGERIGVAVE